MLRNQRLFRSTRGIPILLPVQFLATRGIVFSHFANMLARVLKMHCKMQLSLKASSDSVRPVSHESGDNPTVCYTYG
jgi:hypothetical protein